MQIKYGMESVTKDLPQKQTLRARGVTFILIGIACASLRNQSTLHIYENGIGAINLPFRKSEISLDHARSVHPLSLSYMGDLASLAMDDKFEIVNPFLFMTKAQVCEVFKDQHISYLVPFTISCDRCWHDPDAKQCGRCSSCILRREALAVVGIQEDTNYIHQDFNFQQGMVRLSDKDHLPAVIEQVKSLRTCLESDNPWLKLKARFPELERVVKVFTSKNQGALHEITDGLLKLYTNYVAEWDAISA